MTKRDWEGHITDFYYSKVIARSQQARGLPATSASHSAHKGLSAPHCLQLQSTQLAVRLCWACACPFDPSATHMRWASTPPPQGRPRRPAPGAGPGRTASLASPQRAYVERVGRMSAAGSVRVAPAPDRPATTGAPRRWWCPWRRTCRRPATRRRGGPPSRPVCPTCGKAFDESLCNHAT